AVGRPSTRSMLADAVRSLNAWQNAAALELAQPRGGHGGLSQAADPRPGGRVQAIVSQLDRLEQTLTRQSNAAIATARRDAHIADLVRQAATVLGLLILGAGGARLLRRAF